MDDDSRAVDKGWDLPEYAEQTADDAVTRSISTNPTPEWLVNTMDSVVVPMSTADVVEALRVHKLTDRSLVWRNGMPEWTSIDRVPSLKLAARLPATLAPSKPSRPSQPAQAAAPRAPSTAPPAPSTAPAAPSGAPLRPSQTPRPNPTPALGTPAVGLSRRATLPFGMPGPHPSRPSSAKPSSPPSAPPPRSEEPEVLAVYDRPAATISFDLSPSEPARVPPPVPAQAVAAKPAPSSPPPQAPPPQTLAPITTEPRSVARSTPPRAYNPDLSVVAASQFREVQRSSKRRLLVSSLVSAAAASALTLWLSGSLPWSRTAESKAPPPPAKPTVAQVAAAVPAPAPAPVAVTPAPTPSQTEAPAAPSAAPPSAPLAQAMAAALTVPKPAAPKPKAAGAARPVARGSEPARTAAAGDAKADGNPYDVKLEDDSAQPAKPRGLLEMMQESERPPAETEKPEASAATGSSAPGF